MGEVVFCRSSKGYMGQLTRVLVAIPEGLVQVKVDARVQPSPPPCAVFMPSPDGAIMLPAGNIWTVRLPYPCTFVYNTHLVQISARWSNRSIN